MYVYPRSIKCISYTQHKQNYISLIMSKIRTFQSNIFSSECIDNYFDTWPIFNIYLKN